MVQGQASNMRTSACPMGKEPMRWNFRLTTNKAIESMTRTTKLGSARLLTPHVALNISNICATVKDANGSAGMFPLCLGRGAAPCAFNILYRHMHGFTHEARQTLQHLRLQPACKHESSSRIRARAIAAAVARPRLVRDAVAHVGLELRALHGQHLLNSSKTATMTTVPGNRDGTSAHTR